MKTGKIHKKRKKIIICTISAVIVAYIIAVNLLVSAALVPDFMERLEAFGRITEKSYSELVQTADIQENLQTALDAEHEWLKEVQSQKLYEETEDGYTLVANEFLLQEESSKWVILLHGYTGWKEAMYTFAYWYYQQGFHVIVPDLRCQGESEGDFIGMGWTDHYDCMLWIDHILSQDPDAEIVLHGQSMGAAAALMMSGENFLPDNVKAVISDCAYTDAYSMFEDKIKDWFHLPAFPIVDTACLMLRLRGGYNLYDASALEAVKQSSTPTLFIHGSEDAMIPVEMAYELYEAASCEKELLIMDGAGHAQSQDKDPELYYGTIERFLEKCE